MITTLITEMYGGKIDDEADWRILASIVQECMTPAAFEDNFKIVNDLPEREPPTYLGLPANAEKLLLVGQAKEMVGNLKKVVEMLDEGEQIMAEAES
jgi:dynein heavy chain 1